jgi:hypothetical protein
MADKPMVTGTPVHDHRFGPCTLPTRITPETASLNHRRGSCHWSGTATFNCARHDNGAREWNNIRRADRRHSRHQTRQALRTQLHED